ncbi:unknown protein [Microcystis aeruginosa NIES-843]|uniref:Uncharacterized protein n=1 Tax=Microcystis aeruginosa (strain NIES-843 / IAM M-2473) TaxID=449447 RepID=B0JRT9_MICAN|nr:unknown protein [Microcystis aeruginosa NIES-843]
MWEGFLPFSLSFHLSTLLSVYSSLPNLFQYIHRKFGSETPSFYDGFTVKYEHRLRNIC